MSTRRARKTTPPVSALFLDIGGILLTNGWDTDDRAAAVKTFGLDAEETEQRHHLNFETHELGKLSLDEYLRRVIFYEPRAFSMEDFTAFMQSRSKAYPDMLAYVRELKARHRLKIFAVSNEGRELTVYRIGKFKLGEFMDCFVSSCFVHLRKPDAEIYRLALDLAAVPPAEVVCIDDRPLFVEIAEAAGLRGICHTDCAATRKELGKMGLIL